MNLSNPINSLAEALHAACLRDLPDIEYKYRKPGSPVETAVTKLRRPRPDECSAYQFPQTWSSTALGFGGIGGQAITTADTTAVVAGRTAAVYFSGRFAYIVPKIEAAFWDDLRDFHLVSQSDAIEKYGAQVE